MSFSGKVVLITGGASGIGAATARHLAEQGAKVALADLDAARAAELAASMGGIGVAVDVGEPGQLDAAFERARAELGPVHAVLMSAGASLASNDISALDDEIYRRMMRANVDGVVFTTRAAQRAGVERALVIASLSGLVPFRHDPIYALTKHAVVGFVRSLPETALKVNALCIGLVDTPIIERSIRRIIKAIRYPMIPMSDAVAQVVERMAADEHGKTWILQPGMPAWCEAPPVIPGPFLETWRPPDYAARARAKSE